MSEVVSLDLFRRKEPVKKEPDNFRFGGQAQCLACKHTWEATAVGGQSDLECPECKSWRGVFSGPYELPEDVLVFTCAPCGSQTFRITAYGSFCLGCGHHDTIPPPPP